MDSSESRITIPSFGSKPVTINFSGGDITSDGGWALVGLADDKIGLTRSMAAAIKDLRDPEKVLHSCEEQVRARVYGITNGYEDCNDHDFLREDPCLKSVCGSSPDDGADLASQPTLSRFENASGWRDLIRCGRVILRSAVAQIPKESPRIYLDVDATDDPTHGQQQLCLFNGHYLNYCYLPLHVFATGSDGRKRALASVLRPGNASYKTGLKGTLRAVVRALRERFPDSEIILRADSDFGNAEVIKFCRRHGLKFLLGVSGNPRLITLGIPAMLRVAAEKTATKGDPWVFDEFEYQAETWPTPHRVIVKAEVTQEKLNPRFVTTNLKELPPEIYASYCDRGECENRIKELKLDLFSGRTSCTRFLANQFRLLLHTAAMVLMQALQDAAADTKYAKAQAATLRLRLLKVGGRIREVKRRIWFHLSSSYPDRHDWLAIAGRLLAG